MLDQVSGPMPRALSARSPLCVLCQPVVGGGDRFHFPPFGTRLHRLRNRAGVLSALAPETGIVLRLHAFAPKRHHFAATPNSGEGSSQCKKSPAIGRGSVTGGGSMPQSFYQDGQHANNGRHTQPVRHRARDMKWTAWGGLLGGKIWPTDIGRRRARGTRILLIISCNGAASVARRASVIA